VSLTIEYSADPSFADKQFLTTGICQEAALKKGLSPIEPFAFFLKDETGNTVGGITGVCYYGCLFIDELYVSPDYRGKGWGSRLMDAAECHDRHCTFYTVTTMDWEARDFYEKHGYKVEFVRSGYEKDSRLYFMRKNFIPQG
jgi:GNAT superfamily N-acetyltransferase